MRRGLRGRLDALVASTDVAARVATDPVRFPRRYAEPGDAEVAAVLAALLAFGRVDLFGPVAERILALADDDGGPAAFVDRFDARRAARLEGIYYRWLRADAFAGVFTTLRAVRTRHGGLGALFAPGPLRESLGGAMHALAALGTAPARWLAHPDDGSACKRWCMLCRWMVRRDAVDLGLWAHLHPRDLVIPLDTHVHRVARLVGLTDRATPGWATAEAVTAALRRFDPDDPVRYDFALAHLGISGACVGAWSEAACPACPLGPVCVEGRGPRRAGVSSGSGARSGC